LIACIIAETARWSVEEQISVNGGVVSTADNLFSRARHRRIAAYTGALENSGPSDQVRHRFHPRHFL
jgi:hypothetical protein